MPFSAESSRGALLPKVGECGLQTSDRIIGGEKTKLDEHPWSALLEYEKCKFGFFKHHRSLRFF